MSNHDVNIFSPYLLKLSKIPLSILIPIILNCFYGFLILYSAGGMNLNPWAYKQILFFIMFLPISLIIAVIDIRFIYKSSYMFYILILILLIAVSFLGHSAMGAKRWVSLGIIKIQPSEPAKIAIVLMLARYFHNMNLTSITRIRHILLPAIMVLLPSILIIKQPDLGTGLIVMIVSAIIFFIAGVSLWFFATGIILVLGALPIAWNFLHDYQKKRILMFLNPETDPLGAGYNIIQSKIAIGSGGVLGKGLFQGTQSKLEFLPEHQTDFIFPTLSEELGFTGGGILLLLYAIIFYFSISSAINSKSFFGKFIIVGIISIFFFHVFINMAMVMGLLPVVGIPLPFMSYGGTMMGSMFIGFGLIFNVHVHNRIKIG